MVDLIDAATREDAIGQRVRGWAVSILGITTIFSHPGAPRPPRPYCMINLINSRCTGETGVVIHEEVVVGEGEGEGEEVEEGEGEFETRIVQRRAEDWEWTYSVHLYGDGAVDQAQRLVSSLNNGTVRLESFSPLVVREPAFGRRGLVRRIPEQVENAWEMRANFDVTVAGIVLEGFLVDVAESGIIRVGEVDVPFGAQP